MSKYLCTFSGKNGDILWSLATAKFIAEKICGGKVDFAIMPYYKSLLPLIEFQPYIDKAFAIEDWLRTHSNHGDGPWNPPVHVQHNYERYWHLTYQSHPGISAPSMALIDFVAYQHGISFHNYQPIPFLEAPNPANYLSAIAPNGFDEANALDGLRDGRLIPYALNEMYKEAKQEFLAAVIKEGHDFAFVDVANYPWEVAASIINEAIMYVGCRSACWVIAEGLGKQTITFEPHPARHKASHLGPVFSNPYGKEIALPFGMPNAEAGKAAVAMLRKKREEVVLVNAT